MAFKSVNSIRDELGQLREAALETHPLLQEEPVKKFLVLAEAVIGGKIEAQKKKLVQHGFEVELGLRKDAPGSSLAIDVELSFLDLAKFFGAGYADNVGIAVGMAELKRRIMEMGGVADVMFSWGAKHAIHVPPAEQVSVSAILQNGTAYGTDLKVHFVIDLTPPDRGVAARRRSPPPHAKRTS